MVALGLALAAIVFVPASSHAQSAWESAVTVLMTSFTRPIARGLSLVLQDQVDNAGIPINPLGLTITYFREDQAFVNETGRTP